MSGIKEYLGLISKFYENRMKFFFFLRSLILVQKENDIEKRSKKFSTNVATWKQSLIEGYSWIHSSVRGNGSIFSGPFSSSIYDLPFSLLSTPRQLVQWDHSSVSP